MDIACDQISGHGYTQTGQERTEQGGAATVHAHQKDQWSLALQLNPINALNLGELPPRNQGPLDLLGFD
jgi:hypothetical protein